MGSSQATAAATVSNNSVFVYGSLLADDVVRALLNRVPQTSPAILNNYRRFSIKGRVYPAILPLLNNNVHGRVLLDISPPELDILDAFEDVEYERSTVEVSLMNSSEKLQAHAYVWCNKDDPNLFGDWDFEVWKQLHMKDFITMTTTFVEEELPPETKSRVATYESFYRGEAEKL